MGSGDNQKGEDVSEFTISYNPAVLKTIAVMLYLMVGVVIGILRLINDLNVSAIGSAFGWYGGGLPTWAYLLYIPLWPIWFAVMIIMRIVNK